MLEEDVESVAATKTEHDNMYQDVSRCMGEGE